MHNQTVSDPLVDALAASIITQMEKRAPALFHGTPAGSRGADAALLLRTSEVARALGLSVRTVQTLTSRGVFRAVRIGRSVRIPASQVDAYVARGAK